MSQGVGRKCRFCVDPKCKIRCTAELVNKFKLEPKFILLTTVASKPENIEKNRWPEFLTRVKLNVLTGSDYINANYVNMPIGQDEQKWICTQAPLESTIDAVFTSVGIFVQN